jgi:hypothetical protein
MKDTTYRTEGKKPASANPIAKRAHIIPEKLWAAALEQADIPQKSIKMNIHLDGRKTFNNKVFGGSKNR